MSDAPNGSCCSTSAVGDLVQRLADKNDSALQGSRGKQELVESTGNKMLSQFEPWFFAVAFAFCFNALLACPDLEGKPKYRRAPEAPSLRIERWCEVIARRIETQFQRDWGLTYSLWNYRFRTAVNLSRTFYSYGPPAADQETQAQRAEELQQASLSICQALRSKYKTPDGKLRPVNGDLTKVRLVPGLPPTARKLLANIEHVTSKIPGTQEVRRKMRHMTHSYRVVYGQPIFVTMSPDEKHNSLMLRLSRVRQKDPANCRDATHAKWGRRTNPSVEEDFVSLSPAALAEALPEYDQRRAILARSPLAAADGFHVLCEVMLEVLFGVRFCPCCPECNADSSQRPCQDRLGSSATAEGGIFGRADAFIGSLECQKAGSLHTHGQLFIQCLHQHASLHRVMQVLEEKGYGLVQGYLDYKAHVSEQAYTEPAGWEEERREAVEEQWPEYQKQSVLMSRPRWLRRSEDFSD